MKKVKEFMDIYSQEIIRELGKKEFNTADVVSTINQRKEWQKEYIKLSEQYGSYNKLNAQIGRYLLNNQNKLEISKNGDKEKATAITGRQSSNQKWIKIIKKQERMNKLKTMALIASLIALYIGANAQTLTPQQNKKSKWGYVNEAGKAVIKHKYNNARAFSDGLAAVSLIKSGKEKFGFIDEKGKVIIPLVCDEVSDFSEGLARVKKVTKLGYIDKTGKEIIPVIYDGIDEFSEGLARVNREGKIGFIDKTGKEIIPLQYSYAMTFSKGFAKVKKGDYWGLIDKSEAEIIPFKYQNIRDFSEGLAAVKRDNKWGFVDTAGKEHIECKYKNVSELSEGLAKVQNDNKWGYIDKTGKVVIPVEYNTAEDFSGGFAIVSKYIDSNYGYSSERWGVFDKTGKQVLPFGYSKTEINSMPLSAFVEKEVQRIQEKERQRKLEEEKKEQRKAEINTLIEEVEVVLDNDYYSANCHPVDVLKNIEAQVDQTLDAIFNGDMEYYMDKNIDNVKYLQQLKTGLSNAIKAQQMTKKYGAATAKKIIAGKYEIGMTKTVVEEIMGVNKVLYKISSTAQSEIWQFDINNPKLYYYSANDKLMLKSQLPTLVFRGGKLTDIYR